MDCPSNVERKEEQRMETPNYDFSYTVNRELSWLKFNERVLKEAADESVPLFERLKFISIFTSNLDEFFMIRVGSLHDLCLLGEESCDNKTGMTASQQLDSIFNAVPPLYRKRDNIFSEVQQLMAHNHVFHTAPQQLKNGSRKFVKHYFENRILPVLSPQIIDIHHPFPHLINKGIYIFLLLKDKSNKKMFGMIPLPSTLPKLIFTPGNKLEYILLEDILLEYSQEVFDSYRILEKNIISVTRNADINPDDEAYDMDEDYRCHMKKILKKRARLAPVRLEIQDTMSSEMEQYLSAKLHLRKEQIFYSCTPLDMKYVFTLAEHLPSVLRTRMSYPPFLPQCSPYISKKDSILSFVQKKDLLLSFPYEEIGPFLHLLKEAAFDQNVISIKITIYRLANQSKLAEYLCLAAENGKDVTILMELRARFDEQNNIGWAERMEEAGCHVIYGFDEYKVHSKICLITRKGKNKIQYITQIGTGNYNEKTAKLYTDLSLLTSNESVGLDAVEFFKNMGIGKLDGYYDTLFVAPYGLKQGLMKQIDMEIEKAVSGREGKIIMKMNSLTDREMIDKLAQASQSGVRIQLIVRGICCLIPGLKGKTENISVISIVGRFLEHSRVYCFGEGSGMNIFISSADLMTRNMDRRVEIACPIADQNLKKQIYDMLQICLHDTVKAKKLNRFGTYTEPENLEKNNLSAQQYFMGEAAERSQWASLQEKKENLLKRAVLQLKNRSTFQK
jgi:polyphosphate kinase 1